MQVRLSTILYFGELRPSSESIGEDMRYEKNTCGCELLYVVWRFFVVLPAGCIRLAANRRLFPAHARAGECGPRCKRRCSEAARTHHVRMVRTQPAELG